MGKYNIIELFKGGFPLGTLVKTTIDGYEREFILGLEKGSSKQERTLLTKGRRGNWFEKIRTQQLLYAEFEVVGVDEIESLECGDKVSVRWCGRYQKCTVLGRDERTLKFYVKTPDGSILSYDYDEIKIV